MNTLMENMMETLKETFDGNSDGKLEIIVVSVCFDQSPADQFAAQVVSVVGNYDSSSFLQKRTSSISPCIHLSQKGEIICLLKKIRSAAYFYPQI